MRRRVGDTRTSGAARKAQCMQDADQHAFNLTVAVQQDAGANAARLEAMGLVSCALPMAVDLESALQTVASLAEQVMMEEETSRELRRDVREHQLRLVKIGALERQLRDAQVTASLHLKRAEAAERAVASARAFDPQDEEFGVKKMSAMRLKGGLAEMLVHWAGDGGTQSWEPAQNVVETEARHHTRTFNYN